MFKKFENHKKMLIEMKNDLEYVTKKLKLIKKKYNIVVPDIHEEEE